MPTPYQQQPTGYAGRYPGMMPQDRPAWQQHTNDLRNQYAGQQQIAQRYRQNALQNMPLSNPALRAAYPNGYGQTAQPNTTGGMWGSTPTGTSQSGTSTIQTSIQPQNVYSPQQTQEATNQAVAGQQQMGSLDYFIRQLRRPGQALSSPGLTSRALPQVANAMGQANEAAGMIPFQDAQANAQNLLGGQTARENEALGWGRLQSGLNNAQQSMTVDAIMNLLRQFMG